MTILTPAEVHTREAAIELANGVDLLHANELIGLVSIIDRLAAEVVALRAKVSALDLALKLVAKACDDSANEHPHDSTEHMVASELAAYTRSVTLGATP